MGNALIAKSSNTITESKIAELINNWALNDYDDGLNYNKTKPLLLWSQLLKKRACCTNQGEMTLAFPNLIRDKNDETKFVGISTTSGTPVIAKNESGQPYGTPDITFTNDYYSPLAFKVYNNDCKFPTENSSEIGNYKIIVNKDGSFNWDIPDSKCKTLYNGTSASTSNIKSFCEHVKEDRQKTYSKPSQIAYGPFINDSNDNAYTDCNCKNSLIRKIKDNIKVYDENQEKLEPHLSDDLLVQYLDQRCVNIQSYNDTYERNIQNLCIGTYNITNNSLAEGAQINAGLNCSFNTNDIPSVPSNIQPVPIPAPVPVPAPGPRTRPKQTTTSASTSTSLEFKPYDKQKLNVVVIVASVVGSLAMLIYMIITIILAVKHS